MAAIPVEIAAPADLKASDCLSPSKGSNDGGARVEALLAEARVWPIRALEPGDEMLPASMPDRFKPQVVVMDADLDRNGRVSTCRVHQHSTFAVLDTASCDLVRAHYVATPPVQPGRIRTAVIWTSRSPDPERAPCRDNGGTVPVASSIWITGDVFKGAGLQNGSALIALDVGTKGFADRCVVLAADVTAALQRNVCRMAVQRATVMPAVDQDGNLVPARLKLLVRLHK